MKKTHIYLLLFTTISQIFSQETIQTPEKYTAHNKGKFYIFWGGNRESFSKSDITFKGVDYNFTLYNVTAADKPKGWHADYFNPARMTIPQTNFRMGYFINDHYNISIGFDHMKYVMNQNQNVKISGTYPTLYDTSVISNETVDLSDESFLTFEHTDGLNYIHTEFSRVDDISKIFKIKNTDKIQINLTEGIGTGILLPKTNTKLFDKERYDQFHLSGYGVSAKVGLNITFFKHFFIQSELKAGYINMNNIRTTSDKNDSATQNFCFLQRIIAVGGLFKI